MQAWSKKLTCPLFTNPCLAARISAVVSPSGTLTANSFEYTGFCLKVAKTNGTELMVKHVAIAKNENTENRFSASIKYCFIVAEVKSRNKKNTDKRQLSELATLHFW